MMKKLLLVLMVSSLGILGCSSTKEVAKEEPKPATKEPVRRPAVPDGKVTVATMDLTSLQRKIEKEDINEITKLLRSHNVDILAVQGIRRYPALKTRLDFVDELAANADLRSAFGECINLSGRQTGNAVFSEYPINTQWNTAYEGIASKGFESALQAVIDCGAREVVVISTRLPEKASSEDMTTCVKTLSSFKNYYVNDPLIVAGNLPESDVFRSLTHFRNVKEPKGNDETHLWYSDDGSVVLLSVRVQPSSLSPIVIAEFGIFRRNPQ